MPKKKFTSEYQPENRGRKKGSLGAKTLLKKLLRLTKKTVDPLNPDSGVQNITYAELLHAKQILNALEGDLNAYKEIMNRVHGPITSKHEIKQDVSIQKPLTKEEIEQAKKDFNDLL